MRTFYLLLILSFLSGLTGCAQKTINDNRISGNWLIDITTADVGKLQMVMNFDAEEHKGKDSLLFHAYTERDMDKKILGTVKAQVGRWFGSNFEKGSLIRITKAVVTKDSVFGVLVTPFGNYYINSRLQGGKMAGCLANGKHICIGGFEGIKGQPTVPLRNYTAITEEVLKVSEAKLYDPALLNTDGWKSFKKELRHVSAISNDDAAFLMGFFYYSRKLPFSHYALFRKMPVAETADGNTRFTEIEEKSSKTVYLCIKSFSGGAAEMDSVFAVITSKNYQNLIVDLRGNSGGAIEAGMGFLHHVLPDTLYGGIFLTQKYFRQSATPPLPASYRQYSHFSEANYDLLMKGISESPAICLLAYPVAPVFKGKIFVLTDGNTASTCEPIVYTLKQHHIATIAGSKTAGAMLNGESLPLRDDYMLMIPTATYYTSDGYKIDKQGVVPDIALKEHEDALAYVLKTLQVQ